MSLNQMILCSKLKNGLWKIITKSQVVTKFNFTKSRLHCTFFGLGITRASERMSWEQNKIFFFTSKWNAMIISFSINDKIISFDPLPYGRKRCPTVRNSFFTMPKGQLI